MSYIIYVRRSTDDADKQQNSIEYQKTACIEYAKRENLSIAKLTVPQFMENGIIVEKHSAFKQKEITMKDGMVSYRIERPKFAQMANLLRNSKDIKGVIALTWDRLSRGDQSDMVCIDLVNRGMVHLTDGQVDGSPDGRFMLRVLGAKAEGESLKTQMRVRLTFDKLHKEGLFPHKAPIGYKNARDEKGRPIIVIDEDMAPRVKRFFQMYADGAIRVKDMERVASELGIGWSRRRKRTMDEILGGVEVMPEVRPLSRARLYKILQSPFYVGILPGGNMGKHEPLIDQALFARVQRAREEKTTTSLPDGKIDAAIFRGIARCECGRGITPYIKKGRYYYGCINGCRKTHISEAKIDEAVSADIAQLSPTLRPQLEIVRQGLDNLGSVTPETTEKILQGIGERRSGADQRLERARGLFMSGDLTKEDYEAERELAKKELAEIAKDEENFLNMSKDLQAQIKVIELLLMACESYNQLSPEKKRSLVQNLYIELVFDDKRLARARPKDDVLSLVNCGKETLVGQGGVNRTFPPPPATISFSFCESLYSSLSMALA